MGGGEQQDDNNQQGANDQQVGDWMVGDGPSWTDVYFAIHIEDHTQNVGPVLPDEFDVNLIQ